MLLDIIYIVVGLVFLVWSADKFIEGASDTAVYLGMSPLMVGVLIVGFGTSAPEMIVSAFAAYNGSPGIALGNAYGSNITNIGLVLGLTALFYPITVSSRIVRREVPLLIMMLLVSYGFFSDLGLTRSEALVMVIIMLLLTVYSLFYSGENDALEAQFESDISGKKVRLSVSIFWLVLGLVILLISSNMLVTGSVNIARFFGVSELVIGLTIVAIGTSLPELAASIVAARKKESDIIMGNIIGSCLFNILGVVGIAGSIYPLEISNIFLKRDFPITFFITFFLFILVFGIRKNVVLGRLKGSALILLYLIYTAILMVTLTLN